MGRNKGQFIKGMIPWNKNKKGIMPSRCGFQKGHKINIGGNKGSFKKGIHPKTEWKKGEHGSFKTEWKKGRKTWNKGLKGYNSGYNHYNWQGGKSFEPYSTDWTQTLKRSIRERDNYICQKCNQYGNEVHHIDYNKKNCNPNNLINLCHKCHLKTNFNRNYWTNYFNK